MTIGTEPGPSSAISLAGVTKSYGHVLAVDDLSLEVSKGEFLTLLGPSGCGKTTTLRTIGGFEYPDRGRVAILGTDVTVLPPFRRSVNTVFQRYALFPHLTVGENVAYGLKARGLNRSDQLSRVREMLKLVQLEGTQERRPRELSGGQQQRIALARALAPQPEVLLLDEPLGSLDYKLRKEMQFELKEIHHKLGTTFVYVTHDQEEALAMSDRICVMRRGRIVQDADPTTIYDAPGTRYVADFVGNMNFLPGTVVDADRRVVEVKGIGRLAIQEAQSLLGHSGITVGIRHEDVQVRAVAAADEEPTEVNSFRAICLESLPIGSYVRLVLEAQGCRVVADLRRSEHVPGRDDEVIVTFPGRRCRAFVEDES